MRPTCWSGHKANIRIYIEVRLSSFLHISHTLTHWGAWVREEKLSQVREREQLLEIIFSIFGFYYCHWCPFYLWGSCRVFSFTVPPRKNSLCLLSLVIIAKHVILLDKILRSYCLNDKNLTVMSLLFKIVMKIILFLIHFLKISLLDKVINSFFMAYLLILIFHLIKNISLIFSQKLSAVMSQHIIVMDLNHTDIEKENRKD